jgi:hypothetical protein
MAKVDSYERVYDFGIRGKLGRPFEFGERLYSNFNYAEVEYQINQNEYGYRTFGRVIFGTDDIRAGIYQRRHNKGKVVYARLKFYNPANPKTVPQQANRTKFAQGMQAWVNLTQNQKDVYNERSKTYGLHGVNLFLKEYLNSN